MVLRKLILSLALAALLLLPQASPPAQAADLPGQTYQGTMENGLSFSIAPFYLWLPGMDGRVGVFGTVADVDYTPIDILKNLGDFLDALDGLYFGAGEVRYGKFGFFYDVVYLDVSSTQDIDGRFINGNIDLGFSQLIATLAGTYRLFETEQAFLDAMAGVRIWDVNVDVGVNLNIVAGTASDGDTWVDPVIGGKGRMQLTENVYASGWALIGGFGANSDFMWDVWGNVGYQWNNWLDLWAGIRATGADYQSGTFVWDAVQYGPIMGFTVKLN